MLKSGGNETLNLGSQRQSNKILSSDQDADGKVNNRFSSSKADIIEQDREESFEHKTEPNEKL